MEKEEKRKYIEEIERNAYEDAKNTKFPLYRRSQWDEWGSPVGLSLGWALFIVPLGLFLYLLHLAGLIG